MTQRVKYYRNFETEFAESRRQDYRLPRDYQWERDDFWWKLGGALLHGLVLLIDFIYRRFVAHVHIKNRKLLRRARGAYYLYANHTQVFGDVVNPYALCWPKRPRVVCSAANLGIPVIGWLLPAAGALPIPVELKQMADFSQVVSSQIKRQRAVVIYPEGHVWPYYTQIRPFQAAAFHYPAKTAAPVFTATTTYQKRRFLKRPKQTIYIDGPFVAPEKLSRKAKQAWLNRTVGVAMRARAKDNNCRYIIYRKR